MKLSIISRLFMKLKGVDVYGINCGHCYHWAYIAYRIYGGKLYYNDNHAFVKIGDRFYDADRLRGVKSMNSLPFFKNYGRTAIDIKKAATIKEFKTFWKRNGSYSWDETLCNLFVKEAKALV